ncbi:MAG: MATE family efflux transporter [Lachnospiraceae bacterium]|nr:MATE family efflux transporter [Lachnospiraceae bacterium]
MQNEKELAAKYRKMTETPVEKLIMQLAVPSIISMLVSALYNMADTFFIGKINTQATGAAGIVFSYMALTQALGFFLGQGSGNFVSRAMGAKDNERAEIMTSTGFFTGLFMAVCIVLPCWFMMDSVLDFFGATPTILVEAKRYFSYILLATPFMVTSFILNNLLRFQGNSLKGMIGITTGAVMNVVLDPILMFVFHMGVSGASLATAFSQTVSAFILIYMSQKYNPVKIHISKLRPSLRVYREIVAGGLPSFARQGLASVATICLNRAARPYGDSAIAAFSVVSRSYMICISALLGFGQGFQPVCGFNYGAKLYDRVKKAFVFCVKVGTTVMTLIGITAFVLAPDIVAAFRADDPELIEIGARALRNEACAFPFMGFTIISNMYLQNTRRTVFATITAVARQGLIFVPLLFILRAAFGLGGVEKAQAISDFLTFCLALPLTIYAFKTQEIANKM